MQIFSRARHEHLRVVDDIPSTAEAQREPHLLMSQIEWPDEVVAMAVCHTALSNLSPEERRAALAWINAKFREDV